MLFIGLFLVIINLFWTAGAVSYLGENAYKYDFRKMNVKQILLTVLFTGPLGWIFSIPILLFIVAANNFEKIFKKLK